MLPYFRLKIDTSNAINPNFDSNQFLNCSKFANQSFGVWRIFEDQLTDFLNKNWLQSLRDFGIPVAGGLMFYREPFLTYPKVHTDAMADGSIGLFSINWVFSPNDDSYMTWYDVPNESGTMVKDDIANIHYLSWSMEDIKDKECNRLCIGNELTLVRVDKPHNVIVNKSPRWAMTLRIAKPRTLFNSWEDVVKFFDDKGLINAVG